MGCAKLPSVLGTRDRCLGFWLGQQEEQAAASHVMVQTDFCCQGYVYAVHYNH